jgi:glycoside/pentoside/hexuronide:cation symporter, GPH family
MTKDLGVWRQRTGYGIADFASNLVWQIIGVYLMYFYTDVVGLVAADVGLIFFAARLIDGFADVAMGVVIDKTKSKWGKSRPWFLWGAAPFAFFGIATFYAPNFGTQGQLVYAFVTYLGLSIAYTVVNIPLSSILPSLTRDPQERTVLATTRIMFAILGSTLVSACTLPMVKLLGGTSQKAGFFWTMVIFAVTGALLFVYTFTSVEEKVKVRHKQITVREAFVSLKGNRHWYIFAVNLLFMWSAYFFQTSTLIYYFTYNVGKPEIASEVAGVSAFVPIFGTFATPFLSSLFHKRTIYMIASVIYLTGIAIMLVAGFDIALLMTGVVVCMAGFGLRTTIYFSMQADPVDFGEWKTGISAPGVISSTNGFLTKVAWASSSAISGWMLTAAHYMPNHPQQASALWVIKLSYLIIPAGLAIVSMIIMSFYDLDKIYPKIRKEIDERNQAHII